MRLYLPDYLSHLSCKPGHCSPGLIRARHRRYQCGPHSGVPDLSDAFAIYTCILSGQTTVGGGSRKMVGAVMDFPPPTRLENGGCTSGVRDSQGVAPLSGQLNREISTAKAAQAASIFSAGVWNSTTIPTRRSSVVLRFGFSPRHTY